MRAVWSSALFLSCFTWAINAQIQSSHNNSNQGNNKHGNSINHIDNTQSNQKQQPMNQQQPQPKGSIWDKPIFFNTKAKDACSMVIFSQANFTKLRVSCKNKGKSYWCDFLGKPNLCKAYNNNPGHYFIYFLFLFSSLFYLSLFIFMWDMRKLHNACQGPRVYKPQMCCFASDEVQMAFHASRPKISHLKPTPAPHDRTQSQQKQQQQTKFSSSTPKTPRQPKPQQPAKPALKPAMPAVVKPVSPRKTAKTTTARPTVAEEGNQATKLAEEYCWSSLQNVCAYFINWFQD